MKSILYVFLISFIFIGCSIKKEIPIYDSTQNSSCVQQCEDYQLKCIILNSEYNKKLEQDFFDKEKKCNQVRYDCIEPSFSCDSNDSYCLREEKIAYSKYFACLRYENSCKNNFYTQGDLSCDQKFLDCFKGCGGKTQSIKEKIF